MEPAILCVGTLHLAHSLLKEGLLAYFAQQNRPDGVPLGSEHLLHLATGAGASALGLDQVGHLSVGMDFDAVWFRPQQGSTTEVVLRHAARAGEALAKIFTLGTLADLAGVWVAGEKIVIGDDIEATAISTSDADLQARRGCRQCTARSSYTRLSIPSWYADGMSTQMTIRVDAEAAAFVDQASQSGEGSRADVINRAIKHEMRRRAARRDAQIYATSTDPALESDAYAQWAAEAASEASTDLD